MGDLIDLDAYRERRKQEGTWPPDEATVRDYWKKRRPLKKPDYDPPPSGTDGPPKVARELAQSAIEGFLHTIEHPVHPI